MLDFFKIKYFFFDEFIKLSYIEFEVTLNDTCCTFHGLLILDQFHSLPFTIVLIAVLKKTEQTYYWKSGDSTGLFPGRSEQRKDYPDGACFQKTPTIVELGHGLQNKKNEPYVVFHKQNSLLNTITNFARNRNMKLCDRMAEWSGHYSALSITERSFSAIFT